MPNWLLVVILAVVFTAVLAIAQGVYWAYVARLEGEQEELRRRLSGSVLSEELEQQLFREQAADKAAESLGNFGQKLQSLLTTADSKVTVSQLVIRMLALGAVGVVVGGIAVGLPGMLLGPILAAAPYFLLSYQANARSRALVEQLPDTLDLMSRSLQAGLGLNDAFKLAAEEMPMPVAAEFGRVFEEVRFGRDYREAFEKMLRRNPDAFDLRLMVSSILLQRETGGNLIEILENISETIRARFAFEGKVRAMTSEAKFSAVILGGLPFAVLLMLTVMNPEYLSPLFNDPKGNIILAMDITMYTIGIMIMRDLTNVQV